MPQRNAFRFLVPAVAAALLAWWWTGRDQADSKATPETASAKAISPAVSQVPLVSPASKAIIPGGFVAPRLEVATPTEIGAMRAAEVERSAGSPEPPGSFTGVDGKRHAFQYNQTSRLSPAAVIEEARDVRRKLLMQQLRASPQGFARDHQLAAKQVQWILDGSEDFPDRLLD